MHDIIVFLGPSLSQREAQNILPNALYLPPIRCGDIIKAMRLNPTLIVIIDGIFDGAPAVWHKEILWALSQGISVVGAASMGALRAAEMHTFGMIGIGKIYEYYKEHFAAQDADVALIYQQQDDHTFLPLSDPLINIKETLKKARPVIGADCCDHLLRENENIYYKHRHFITWIKDADLSPAAMTWLTTHYVDQKKEDALTCLREVSQLSFKKPMPYCPPTIYLRTLIREMHCEPFIIFHEALPRDEKIVLIARCFGKEYIVAKRLARLLYLMHQLKKNNLFSCDYPEKHHDALKRLFFLLDKPLEGTPPFLQDTYVNAIQQTMRLWHHVYHATQQFGLHVQEGEWHSHAQALMRELGIHDLTSFETFLNNQAIDEPFFTEFVTQTYYFKYFVHLNNFALAFTDVDLMSFWLLEAIKLTGLYDKTLQLMQHADKDNYLTQVAHSLAAKGTAYAKRLDFQEGLSAVNSFIKNIKLIDLM